MKKFLFLLPVLSLFLFCPTLFAQYQVGVNPLTGTANVAIPVYQINKGSVSVPVTLVYGGRGIKPKDVESSAGIGWYLSAGGQVSRELRGLPDDCQKDNSGNARLGWLYNNNGNGISNFSIANDNTTNTCTDETADINYINTNFTGYSDTEPDIFNVSAPGLSCQLVLDKSHVFKALSYQDLKIEYSIDVFGISSFTITNNKGTKYIFTLREQVTQIALPTTSTTVTYFGNAYKQYQYGINFFNNWYLTSITDANGNTVSLNYTVGPDRTSNNPVELFIGGSTTKSTQYTIQQTAQQKILSSISNGTDQLTFNWQSNDYGAGGTNLSYISSVSGMGRSFQFTYSLVAFPRTGSGNYYRVFLRGVNDSGCSSPINYNFTYNGETGVKTATGTTYTTTLSDSSSTFTDYWGYQNTNSFTSPVPIIYVNPSTPAYPRYTNYINPASVGSTYAYLLGRNGKFVDASSIIYGSLSTMTNASGGVTTFTYEPNDYLDIPTNSVVSGNGIRVKAISDNDGTGNNIVRNYSYLDPATNKSSGKPITLPIYAFTIPYTGSATDGVYWDNATVISANDLSSDDHTILYKYCKENKTGAGSTLYQYYVPATQWDNSATPACASCSTAEWYPTQTNVARPTCVSYGPIRNDIYTYPVAPAANYSMERGLIQQVTNYNDAGTKVSETAYTYQRTSPPLIIQALKFDDNNGVKAYAKYNLYASTSELTSQVTKKVYDSPTLTQALSSTTTYTYGNTYHRLTKQQTTNSDNSIVSVNTSYSKDYAIAAPGTDSTTNAIYHLQKQNIDVPIESYTQVTRSGVTKTVGAQLTKFKTFTGNPYFYLPVQSLKFVSTDGDTFTPFAITGGVAIADPKYIPTANYTAYDNTGLLQTGDDNYKHVQTGITDHFSNQSVALFKNTAVSETGFEDFDSSLPPGTNYTLPISTGIVNTNSHNGNAYTFSTGQNISKVMSKKAGENYYTLSAWISSASAGTINLTLTNSSNGSFTYNEPFTNTGNVSKYFEWKVPVSNMSAGFTMSFSTSQAIYIDDILFYPQSAEAVTYAYDPVAHFKISETNTNGVSAYYTNDKFGRIVISYDQDKNIRERKSYLNSDDIAAGLLSPDIRFPPNSPYVTGSSDVNTPISMDANHNPCITDATYTWNFGDGTTASVLNGYHQTHTYTTTGNFTVTCTVSSPSYNTPLSSSSTVIIKYPDLKPLMCQSGVTMWDNCYHHSLNQVSCFSNPNDATNSYYTITSVGGSGYGTLHYQWQLSYDDGQTWTNDGTDTSQFSVPCFGKNQKYNIRCVVTSSVGQTGTSSIAFFNVQDCQ
ncbi:PKD domain-containing protein [Mucilaginibacter sp. OK268]|uniref:PKD domain-containing protein n=1 Tax=Mucilaginibacter sp. OK268 TaxID=1881048 RepID=UPI000881DBD5|nr:PKD domain-containing protein [Mucilaginibacter sp. OK268]SDQ01651.1 PKD domain-containing protein [Mucilaginibacter sp. OK268]